MQTKDLVVGRSYTVKVYSQLLELKLTSIKEGLFMFQNTKTNSKMVVRSARDILKAVPEEKDRLTPQKSLFESEPLKLSPLAQRVAKQKAMDAEKVSGPFHLMVGALAGTGKTSVIIEGLKYMKGQRTQITPSPQQQTIWDSMLLSKDARSICLVAFNKSIARTLQERVPHGVNAMTMHSMGLKACQNAWSLLPGTGAIEGDKVSNIIAELMGVDIWKARKIDPTLVSATIKLVGLCKANLLEPTVENLDFLTGHYEVEIDTERSKVYAMTEEVMEQCLDVMKYRYIDFNDMVWLPVVHKLPVTKYDLICADECVPGWTPVMMGNGSSKEIKDVQIGDVVRSLDVKTGKATNCKVSAVQKLHNVKPLVKVKVKHDYRPGRIRKANFVVCTTDHKIWTKNRGWVEAGQLIPGDVAVVETSATTSQKGKITKVGRNKLSEIHVGNTKGVGFAGKTTAEDFNRIKGGNGRGPTVPQLLLQNALGKDWKLEHVVPTKLSHTNPEYPSCYKIDIANVKNKIAIELDGGSHNDAKRDEKKTKFLESKGWKIFRFKNKEVARDFPSIIQQVCPDGSSCPISATVVSVDPTYATDYYVYDITVENCHNFYANGILVHNCQDLNNSQQELLIMSGHRILMVGDKNQSIYGWAGAASNGMEILFQRLSKTERGCKILPLTVTRRCGRAIVREAQKLVPEFEAHEDNPAGAISNMAYEGEGSGNYRSYVSPGDMVLCRVNAPLVSQAFKFIKSGVKAQIQGRDLGAGLISLVKKFQAYDIVDLVKELDQWLILEQNKEKAKKYPSDAKFLSLQDKFDCIMCFVEEASTVQGVIDRIDSIFTDSNHIAGVLLSTVHKAKGLEADKVFLLMPPGAQIPHPMAKSEWQKEGERCVLYVAQTRPIHELIYVT